MVRLGMAEALRAYALIELVTEVEAIGVASRAIQWHDVDILILRTALDRGDLASLVHLRETAPEVAVIVVGDEGADKRLASGLSAGIRGYVTPQDSVHSLQKVVAAVAGGELAIPRRLQRGVIDELVVRHQVHLEGVTRLMRLSPQERRVLRLVASGSSSDEIAARLGISHRTVQTHVSHVLAKLEVHSRAEAALFVWRHRLETLLDSGDQGSA